MSDTPNQTSQTSFNQNHALYDKVRPSYTDETLSTTIKAASITAGSVVIDMAAGTGKFSVRLHEKVPDCEIIAVEPSGGMLESYRLNLPNVRTIQAPAASVPDLPDGIADTIVVAQAFHWFAKYSSLKEFHRLLKAGGTLVLIWNFEDTQSLPADNWQRRATELIHTYDGAVPQYRHGKWREPFSETPRLFGPLSEETQAFERIVPNQEVFWQYWLSRSYITALGPKELSDLRSKFDQVMKDTNAAKTDLVAKGGTHIVWTKKV